MVGCSVVVAGNTAVLGLEIAACVRPLLHDGFSRRGSNREFPQPSGSAMAQQTKLPTLLGSGKKTDQIGSETLKLLFEAFIRCRTTLDDLSNRAAALGEDLSAPVIAAHLTGKSCISAQQHNVLVAAINAPWPSCRCLDLLSTHTGSKS